MLNDTDIFFQFQIFPITVLLSVPNFSDTGSETFFDINFTDAGSETFSGTGTSHSGTKYTLYTAFIINGAEPGKKIYTSECETCMFFCPFMQEELTT